MSETNGRLSGSEALPRLTENVMAKELKIENELHSAMDFASARAQANHKALLALMAVMRTEEDAIRLGGGANAAEAQHTKGRLTARERLKLLLDEGSEFVELGLWAAHGMYAEYGGAPSAGVVTGSGPSEPGGCA
jgi:3-methylcrotonyl-CoA carboxylase beta subunit